MHENVQTGTWQNSAIVIAFTNGVWNLLQAFKNSNNIYINKKKYKRHSID